MHRWKMLALAGLAAIALAGCNTLTDLGSWGVTAAGSNAATSASTSPAEATTVAQAEIAFTAAARIETAWLKSGKATPANAKVAKSIRQAVYADLVAARTAVANNDSAAITVALNLFNQALPLFRDYIAKNGGGS